MNIYQSPRDKRLNIYFFIFIAICCFISGALSHRSGFFQNIRNIGTYIYNKKPTWVTEYKLDHIYIDIKFKDFQKKIVERENYLAHGYVGNELSNEYVPVKIQHNNNYYRAKIRFKGFFLDHINHPTKWSYKIQLKENQTIFGLREFSIQRPGTRNGLGEWLFMKLVASAGIATPHYEFINVTQNGKYLGVFAIEGRFNQDFRAKNKLKEGPIIKFDPILFLKNKENLGIVRNAVENTDWSTYSDPITAYELDLKFTNINFQNGIDRGVTLYEGLRNQTYKVGQAFDIIKLAKYYALCDITGSQHATQHSSLKAYYNPTTDILEPVAWDANGIRTISSSGNGYGSFIFAEEPSSNFDIDFKNRRYEHRMLWLLEDKEFYKEYIKQLNNFTEKRFVENFFTSNKSMIESIAHHLQLSKGLNSYDVARDVILDNQNYVRARLNPPKSVNAFFHKQDNNQISLSVGNIQYLPIEIINIKIFDKMFYPLNRVELSRRDFDSPTNYQLIDFENPSNMLLNREELENLLIVYKIIGMNKLITSNVYPHSNLDDEPVENYILKQLPNHETFTFFVTDEQEKRIYIKSGKWKINKNIRLPAGYKVICGENTTLDISNKAIILSESPFEFIGTEDKPIFFISTDGTGQGIFIMNTSKSVFQNVVFDNFSNPSFGNWSLSGSVNFYNSSVRFENCIFSNNHSEDVLNIIHSKFEIINCRFHNIYSDAFDSDFSSGLIKGSTFEKIGNDAIDASGTLCTMEDITIDSVQDKGISAGEESKIILKNIKINNSKIGLASKDLSIIRGNNVIISNSKLGIAIFQKKEEYGPGFVYLNNFKSNNIVEEYLIEKGSLLEINESIIPATIDNVKSLLYGKQYEKPIGS